MANETLNKVPADKRWGQMPAHYWPDDAKIISSRLIMVEVLGHDMRRLVCESYAKAYREAWEAEPVSYRKVGKARFAANTRLRIFISKRFAVFSR